MAGQGTAHDSSTLDCIQSWLNFLLVWSVGQRQAPQMLSGATTKLALVYGLQQRVAALTSI